MRSLLVLVLTSAAVHASIVPLCITQLTRVDNFAVARAQAIAGDVLSDAGVGVTWLSSKECKHAPAAALHLILEAEVPARFGPGTMGYTQPYASRPEIHIFYGRIYLNHRNELATVLGHVIAHEIGHVLEGIVRHSSDGIMKASWTSQDYMAMKQKHLRFDAQDVAFIRVNLQHGVI